MEWRGPFVVNTKVGKSDYLITVRGKKKLFHANLLKAYKERDSSINTMAVVDEKNDDEWEGVSTTHQEIPVIPLQAEESVDDITLHPEAPEIHDRPFAKLTGQHLAAEDPAREHRQQQGAERQHDVAGDDVSKVDEV